MGKIKAIDKSGTPSKKIVLKEGGQYIYDELQIANSFAKHYSKISLSNIT